MHLARWSIARSEGREVIPSGIGWELFLNYLIAKEKFQPDFFLYENNNSIAPAIKAQISSELGVDLMMIDAALVSAQSRERVYGFNWAVEQPADRGIYLSDILVDEPDSDGYSIKDLSENEMVYMLRTVGSSRERVRNHFDFAYTSQSWKPKSSCVLANWSKGVPYNTLIERAPDRDHREQGQESSQARQQTVSHLLSASQSGNALRGGRWCRRENGPVSLSREPRRRPQDL